MSDVSADINTYFGPETRTIIEGWDEAAGAPTSHRKQRDNIVSFNNFPEHRTRPRCGKRLEEPAPIDITNRCSFQIAQEAKKFSAVVPVNTAAAFLTPAAFQTTMANLPVPNQPSQTRKMKLIFFGQGFTVSIP